MAGLEAFAENNSPKMGLTDFLPEATDQVSLPKAALVNEAAKTALIASPENSLVSDFRTYVAQAEQGNLGPIKTAQQDVLNKNANSNSQTLLGLLADSTVPFDVKRQALENSRKASIMDDPSVTLFTKGLEKPSDGENHEQELARISVSDEIAKSYKAREQVQGLVNAHGMSLEDVSGKTLAEAIELYMMPFGGNIAAGKLASAMADPATKRSLWESMKGFLLPGNTIADIRKQRDALTPEQQLEAAQKIISAIKGSSGVLFSNKNNINEWDKASSIFEKGGYSGTQQFLDNIAGVLDIVGLGETIRSSSKFIKGLGKTEKVVSPNRIDPGMFKDTPTTAQKAPPSGFEPAKVSTPPVSTGERQKAISDLENQRASLLGDSSGLLEPGSIRQLQTDLANLKKPNNSPEAIKERAKELQGKDVSSKQALSKAQSEIDNQVADYEATYQRISQRIEQNAAAASNEQRLAALDKQISDLKKGSQASEGFVPNQLSDMIKRIEWNSTVRTSHPSSPASILQQTNPSSARAMHETVVNAGTDEAASALYGTTKVDAVASDIIPQAVTQSGAVTTKVPDIGRNLRRMPEVPEWIKTVLGKSGRIDFTEAEKKAATANIVNDWRNASELTINDAMSSFSREGGRVKISAVYGTTEGGFLRAVDAAEQAILHLRKFGVSEDEITILKKEGIDHVPVDKKNVPEGDGNFLVRIDTYHDIDPTSVVTMEKGDVKLNFLDRFPIFARMSLNRNLVDPASMLSPLYTSAASRANDLTSRFTKNLLEMADDYAKTLKSLPKANQERVVDYFKEANQNSLPLDHADLLSRGWNATEIDAAVKWRKFWDAHYYLENYDLVKTLTHQGYDMLVNGNFTSYVKKVAKNQNIGKVYDPSLDASRTLSKQEMDDLYTQGGTYARLRRPTMINGEMFEHVIVRQNLNEYTRRLKDTDMVLNYRDGYFQIQYNAAKFVDETDANGITRAVAVAGDTRDATTFATRMNGAGNGKHYTVRDDAGLFMKDSDSWWDIESASGRIAQRHRGKLLEDSAGITKLGDHNFVVDPTEGAIRAAKSISGRTVTRPMLETAKMRFIQQYRKYLKEDIYGDVRFPGKIDDIGKKGVFTDSEIADARTTFEYINYLENGYINTIDIGVKALMNVMAGYMGRASLATSGKLSTALAKGERAATFFRDGQGPVSTAKNAAFTGYIALFPQRQLLVQGHQAVRLFAYDPVSFPKAKMYEADFIRYKVSEISGNATHSPFTKFVEDSGLMDAVDKQNLVRGALKEIADSSNAVVRTAGKIKDVPRKIGFDIGEQANMLSHLAAVYARYERLGKDLSKLEVQDAAVAEARAVSYEMNFAGDMAYNQTSAAAILQFLQVPHKAFLQVVNRKIDTGTKIRLILGDILLFGAPVTAVSSLMGGDILPDNPKQRDMLVDGVIQWGYNKIIASLSGSPSDIDFSSLDPYDISGFQKLAAALWSDGGEQLILNSPSGRFFFQSGGKMQNLITTMARFFSPVEDPDETPATLIDIAKAGAELASGWAAADKARLMLETGRRLNQYGLPSNEVATTMDAVAQFFGFGSYTQAKQFEAAQQVTKFNKAREEEAMKAADDTMRFYSKILKDGQGDPMWATKVSGYALTVFKDSPEAQKVYLKRVFQKMADSEQGLMYSILKASGYHDAEKIKDVIRMSGASPEDINAAFKVIEDVKNATPTKD